MWIKCIFVSELFKIDLSNLTKKVCFKVSLVLMTLHYIQLQGKANVDFWKMNRKSIAEFFDTGIFLYFKKRRGKTILGVMRKLNVTGYLKYTDKRLYMFEVGFFPNCNAGASVWILRLIIIFSEDLIKIEQCTGT